jgi:hypothetical protein
MMPDPNGLIRLHVCLTGWRQGRRKGSLIRMDIEEFGVRAFFRPARYRLSPGQHMGNLGERVIKITGNDGAARADHHATRLDALFHPVGTEITLRRCVGFRIDIERIIGTGLHAGAATDTAIPVKIDNAIIAREQRTNRADGYTGRVVAVIAAVNRKVAPGMREFSFFHVLYPGSVHPDRNGMLRLARNGAGMAANASAIVYDKPIPHEDIR